jgi:hypothetical protein
MSSITLLGPEPIELVPQRPATAAADGGSVVVRVPASSDTTVSFRVLLTPGQAQSYRARANRGRNIG